MAFTELTPEQYLTGKFRPYGAPLFVFSKDKQEWIDRSPTTRKAGHKLPSGNWIVPTASIIEVSVGTSSEAWREAVAKSLLRFVQNRVSYECR